MKFDWSNIKCENPVPSKTWSCMLSTFPLIFSVHLWIMYDLLKERGCCGIGCGHVPPLTIPQLIKDFIEISHKILNQHEMVNVSMALLHPHWLKQWGQKGIVSGVRLSWMRMAYILMYIWPNIDPRGPIDNMSALVQVMAWHLCDAKPLPKSMLTQFTEGYVFLGLNGLTAFL